MDNVTVGIAGTREAAGTTGTTVLYGKKLTHKKDYL